MIVVALRSGERPRVMEWTGLILALGGLVYLVFPGLTAPSPLSSALMTIAGIAWGFYTLRGRGSQNPLGDTAGNFVYSVPMILVILLFSLERRIHFTVRDLICNSIGRALFGRRICDLVHSFARTNDHACGYCATIGASDRGVERGCISC